MLIYDSTRDTGDVLKKSRYRVVVNETQELIDYLQRPENKAKQWDCRDPETKGFHVETFNKSLDMLAFGWPDGMAELSDAIENIWTDIKPIPRRAFVRHEAGPIVDIGEALAGEPECFRLFKPSTVQKQTIQLQVNVGYRAAVPRYMVANRGMVITALAEVLSFSHHVEIQAISVDEVGTRMEYHFSTATGMSYDVLAYILGHSDYHRRITFGVRESLKGKGIVARSVNFTPDEGAIYFPRLDVKQPAYQSLGQSMEFIGKTLEPYMER